MDEKLYAREYSYLTPAEVGKPAYRQLCKIAGLHPRPEGYGLIHAETAEGERYTLMTSDVEYVRLLATAEAGDRTGVEVPPGKFPRYRRGWPDEWLHRR